MSDKADGARRPSSVKPKPADLQKRRAFAEAIARAELGRFYWSDTQEKALREARLKRRKPT